MRTCVSESMYVCVRIYECMSECVCVCACLCVRMSACMCETVRVCAVREHTYLHAYV